ncbi:MAG: hypothetical protein U0T33_11450 [Bacteroidales bacterium]
MKTSNRLIVILVLFPLCSCTTLKRYSTIEGPFPRNDLATIDLFSSRIIQVPSQKEGKTLWDLSAEAQSQFIKILNTRLPHNGMFFNSFNTRYLTVDDEAEYVYTDHELRLVFSVGRNRYAKGVTPADRLEYIKIRLSLPGDSVLSFRYWDLFSTEYATINIGDVSFTKTIELSSSVKGSEKIVDNTTEKSAGLSASFTGKEDQKVSYRYLKMNGSMKKNSITMEEEGTRECDLAGNIITQVKLSFGKYPLTTVSMISLLDSNGKFNQPAAVIPVYSTASVPLMKNIRDTIFGLLELDYLFRNVKKGENTFAEWDDAVTMYSGSVSSKVPLFTSDDYLPSFYCISASGSDNLLSAKRGDLETCELIFRSYREARDFLAWTGSRVLAAENPGKAVHLANSDQVVISGRDLSPGDFSGPGKLIVREYFRHDY